MTYDATFEKITSRHRELIIVLDEAIIDFVQDRNSLEAFAILAQYAGYYGRFAEEVEVEPSDIAACLTANYNEGRAKAEEALSNEREQQ
jgi:hypothetical protein